MRSAGNGATTGFTSVGLSLLAAAAALQTPVHAQESWKPTRPVTVIAANAPGGTSDRTARELQRILQKHRLVEVPINVVNRQGGNGTIALNQLHASPGDGHVLLIVTSANLSAHIAGLTPYGHGDFTPLAVLMEEYFGVNVRADASIQSARELLDRLRKKPDSLTFGTASIAGNNYTSLASALKKAGVDVKQLKPVTFAGGGQITMALLGGHVDVVNTGLSNMVDHLVQGRMRTLVVTGPRRSWGPFAAVPTWREVGVDVVQTSWRGMMGPKGISSAQIAYWDGVFRKVTQTEDWKAELQENYWVSAYTGAGEVKQRLDAEYVELKQILGELGMARPQ